jgi:NLI interacting factor-like phosphatase
MSKLNLVLDMDNTLIYLEKSRPYLDFFLEECFKTFQNVSIWTAASKGWFEYINEMIFKPIIEKINEKHGESYQFDFVFHDKKCSTRRSFEGLYQFSYITEKRIRKLHRSKKFHEYTIKNTLIIDDNEITFRCNYGNAIKIRAFYSFMEDDEELLKLLKYLKEIVIPHFENYKTVRNLEKRFWS